MLSEAKFTTIDIKDHTTNYTETFTMDISRPCIFILGGENTHSDTAATSYFRCIKDTLANNKITDGLNLYSAYYKFGTRKANFDRLILFYKFRNPKQLADTCGFTQTEIATSYNCYGTDPQYINNIYEFALRPRIYAKNGELLSADKIAKNLRNMVVWAHCHGAYIVRMLEQKMLADPQMAAQLKKTPKLLQNLLVISHAPFAPLENIHFTTLSFVSASDKWASLYNQLVDRLKSSVETSPTMQFAPALLPPECGNIVIADRLKNAPKQNDDDGREHSPIGLRGSPYTDTKLTKHGKMLFTVERNALIMGTSAMLRNKAIPTIPQMLTTQYADYKELKRRGMQLQRLFRTR